MLWTWPTTQHGSLWGEMDRLQREMNRLFEPLTRGPQGNGNFPAVNIWTGDDEVLVTAEIPGLDPDQIEVTVKHDTITVRGCREADALKEGEDYVRQERGNGTFVRSFTLPCSVDGDGVTAQYQKGILQLTLPRSAADKPRRIAVNAG